MSIQQQAREQETTQMLRFYWNRYNDARMDLAFDETLLTDAAAGRAGLHIYSWDRPTIVLGYNQSFDDLNETVVEQLNIPVVRRASGGTGIMHHRDIGVSLALPLSHPEAGGIRSLYRSFAAGVAQGLWVLRVPGETVAFEHAQASPRSAVCFLTHGIDSILLHGKKIFGSAQIRRSKAVLIQGTLLLGLDAELYAAVFDTPEHEIRASLGAVDPLAGNRTPVVGVLANALAERFKLTIVNLEVARAEGSQSTGTPRE